MSARIDQFTAPYFTVQSPKFKSLLEWKSSPSVWTQSCDVFYFTVRTVEYRIFARRMYGPHSSRLNRTFCCEDLEFDQLEVYNA